MEVFLNVLKVTLEEGFMYAILAMGVYITYSILDFPDLSVVLFLLPRNRTADRYDKHP